VTYGSTEDTGRQSTAAMRQPAHVLLATTGPSFNQTINQS